jgi:hypothetical protein
MSNPTSNFGWQMPTNTDLVSALPADFEVFGQAVDTALMDLKGGTTNQVLAKNSDTDMDFKWVADAAGMTDPMTTTGDVIYSSSGSTPARLGIGTAGQVLKVNSGATAPEWVSAGANLDYTLANTGGTALTGSNTVTVSGLTNANFIMIQVDYSSSSTATPFTATLRLNTDSTAKYSYSGLQSIGNISGLQNRLTGSNLNTATSIPLFDSANNAAFGGAATILLTGGNSSGLKTISSMGSAQLAQGGAEAGYFINGAYTGSSVISSISLLSDNGNWDNGTVWVYTSA